MLKITEHHGKVRDLTARARDACGRDEYDTADDRASRRRRSRSNARAAAHRGLRRDHACSGQVDHVMIEVSP